MEGWVDRIWLSLDDQVGDEDVLLREIEIDPPLASLDSYMRTVSLTPPILASLAAGDYQLLVQTDATLTQPELDESNNVDSAAVSLSLPALPDLFVNNIIGAGRGVLEPGD